jgi:hypothetical protein
LTSILALGHRMDLKTTGCKPYRVRAGLLHSGFTDHLNHGLKKPGDQVKYQKWNNGIQH